MVSSGFVHAVVSVSLVYSRLFMTELIASFHCHTTVKTIQQIKSRIKEEREDEYPNSVAKIQVCAMFRAGGIRVNALLKFIRLCMET